MSNARISWNNNTLAMEEEWSHVGYTNFINVVFANIPNTCVNISINDNGSVHIRWQDSSDSTLIPRVCAQHYSVPNDEGENSYTDDGEYYDDSEWWEGKPVSCESCYQLTTNYVTINQPEFTRSPMDICAECIVKY
tara:strand:+ start:2045 stop:2452 length:408 start_codon:yes stop_codon:yes gene_type:complete